MQNSYVVSFLPGSSGRFLASIIWCLVNEVDYNLQITLFNSNHHAHLYNNTITNIDKLDNYSGIDYEQLSWNKIENICAFHSHIYLDFDKIRNNPDLVDTKFIIIRVNENDLLECFCNENYKNHLQGLLGGHGTMFFPEWIYNDYVKLFGYIDKDCLASKLDSDKFQDIILNMYPSYLDRSKDITHTEYRWNFIDVRVPEDFTNRTLIVEYSDIFKDNGTVVLNQLANFFNKTPSNYVLEKFQEYVSGRNKFIKEHLYKIIHLQS